MKTKEAIERLKERFSGAIVEEITSYEKTTLEIRKDRLKEVLKFLKQNPQPGYEVLMDLTGVDYLKPEKRTKIIYHLHNPENLQRLFLTTYVSRDEQVPSVTDLWPGADWYERELFDMFGVQFTGHPMIKRILMPDDWKGHPLRKDYALTEESVEFKHGVKPKIPSEIIPHDKNFRKS